ncbi:restriction endonuclease subunit S [Cronobacter sakazakii]|uniref:restriction endonuclease subunit S n=1 Tax=Cronobacter sakazakii TaxID=28141 RepID=UPI000CFD38E2|nr:restriction endonuclease subunit S [Cronobacter sakazakii]EIZ9492502.1 restriction endonuclease subunit S [Cronobacter sakazakii]EJH4503683.1 restriction endonuclease subunit S [Cronobacter sakazakii]PQY21346.1 restriction endonuclease subunit S [Cronobacter sakazakii]
MSSKFRKVKLCEILSFKTGKLDSNAAVDNGCYPFFTCSPVTLSINTYAFDTEAVLLAGNNANGVFSVKYHNGKFNAYQRTYVITPLNNSEVNVKWLYFRIKYVTSELQSMSVGTATKFLTKKILDAFEIELPTFEEQTYQAKILWGLQDKLANNEAINQTLEQMAQALFKSWFVDFEPVKAKMSVLEAGGSQEDATLAAMTAISGKDANALAVFEREHPEQYVELKTTAELFPSAMQESELGEIPDGWETPAVQDVANTIKGKSYKSSELDRSKTALVTLKSFSRGGGYRLDGLKEYTGKYKPDQEVFAGDLIIAYTDVTQAADVIGKPAMVISDTRYEHLVISLDVAVVRPFNDSLKYYLYGVARTEQFQKHTSSHSTGTTVLHLSKNAVPGYRFILANEGLVNIYAQYAKSIFSKVNTTIEENNCLSELRDTLLPKLLSGEITLPEAEQAVSEAENV